MKRMKEVSDQEWMEVNKFNRQLTEEFLKQGHLSPQTLKQYKSGLRLFFFWVKNELDNMEFVKMKPRHALMYQNHLIELGLSPSAIKFKRASVSSLSGYVETYYSEDYPTFKNIYNKKIPNPGKAFVREKKPLNQEEFAMLLNELEKRGEWQMIAYLKFSYSTGCRRAETRQLRKEIVNYKKVEGKNYYLTHDIRCKGKGKIGKVRKLVYDDEARNAIMKWLEIRGEDDCPFVFVTRYNSKLEQVSESTFNYWCSDVFTPIVGRRVHPHQLREQRATDLVVVQKKDIKAAQALLGHESSETTSIYVIRDSSDDVDSAFDE